MKLIINEDQYKMLQSRNVEDEVNTYIDDISKMLGIVNKIYTKLTFATVSEILSGELNLNEIVKTLDNIEDKIYGLKNKAEKIIEGFYDDDNDKYYEWDKKLTNTYYPIDKKISLLGLLLTDLEGIIDVETEHEFSKAFKDIKPLEI